MNSNNNRRGWFKRTAAVLCAMCMLFSGIAMPASAKVYTMSRSTLPTNTDVKKVSITLKNRKGPLTFQIRAQAGFGQGRKGYIARHGCAVSALTTVLTAYNKKYKDYTRGQVYKTLEKETFGTKAWNANYRKSPGARMPVSLYGISRVLRKHGVKNNYVRRFADAAAVRKIENHLKKGNVAIIEVNNRKQKNGVFSRKYNPRWACSKHTMVLLGMTDKGKVIIGDSATRTWAGSNQRIKYASMDKLVQYMIPCKSSAKYYYYHSQADSGGYILVNP